MPQPRSVFGHMLTLLLTLLLMTTLAASGPRSFGNWTAAFCRGSFRNFDRASTDASLRNHAAALDRGSFGNFQDAAVRTPVDVSSSFRNFLRATPGDRQWWSDGIPRVPAWSGAWFVWYFFIGPLERRPMPLPSRDTS